jgi:hypothetical protein
VRGDTLITGVHTPALNSMLISRRQPQKGVNYIWRKIIGRYLLKLSESFFSLVAGALYNNAGPWADFMYYQRPNPSFKHQGKHRTLTSVSNTMLKLFSNSFQTKRPWHCIRPRNRRPGFESRQGTYKAIRENISMLLCIIDLICIACVLKKRYKWIGPNIYVGRYIDLGKTHIGRKLYLKVIGR